MYGDRHCPHCGGTKRDAWVEDRMSELPPIKYYHVVFTCHRSYAPYDG
ncbi:MAG: transposase zinc-binding domain-containing protein [Saprospiraceae bacterium]|nr:transposase zinc-binding domain-containing protein [Saprospiraceae bacterium]